MPVWLVRVATGLLDACSEANVFLSFAMDATSAEVTRSAFALASTREAIGEVLASNDRASERASVATVAALTRSGLPVCSASDFAGVELACSGLAVDPLRVATGAVVTVSGLVAERTKLVRGELEASSDRANVATLDRAASGCEVTRASLPVCREAVALGAVGTCSVAP